jgi:hypothetical protein
MSRKLIWQNESIVFRKKISIFGKFLTNNRKILRIASAIVVLGSFVVKEVWDERVHSAQEEIRTVIEKSDRIETDAEIFTKVVEVQQSIEELKASANKSTGIDIPSVEQQYLDKVELLENNLDLALDRVDAILEVLHDRKGLDKQRDEVSESILALKRKYSSWTYKDPEDLKSNLMIQYEQIKKDEVTVDVKAHELVWAAERQANSELEGLNKNHALSIRLSYFFFGVGWVLGFATTFLGSSEFSHE